MVIEELRLSLKNIFKEKFETLDTNFDSYRIRNGLGFFPYGSGLLNQKNTKLPTNGILILGKDFGNINYFEQIKDTGEETHITLRNLLQTIPDSSKEKIFLSNVFMGLRNNTFSNLDNFPEQMTVQYLVLCKQFLEFEIEVLKPSKVVTLGSVPNKFLEKNIDVAKLKIENIPHPSMWHVNLKKSGFNKEIITNKIMV